MSQVQAINQTLNNKFNNMNTNSTLIREQNQSANFNGRNTNLRNIIIKNLGATAVEDFVKINNNRFNDRRNSEEYCQQNGQHETVNTNKEAQKQLKNNTSQIQHD